MAVSNLTKTQRKIIRGLVKLYKNSQDIPINFLDILRSHITSDKALKEQIHSVKSRVKDPKSLHDKLERKMRKALELGVATPSLDLIYGTANSRPKRKERPTAAELNMLL